MALLAISTIAPAQTRQSQIKGRLTDQSSKEALPNAAVALLRLKDSSVLTNVVSDAKGAFSIKSPQPGNYLLVATYMGYQQLIRNITIRDTTGLVELGTLALKRRGLDLEEVEIVKIVPPIVIKEDTIEFNAGSFKTRENAMVEELLKKLPGVQVDKEGKITANGETVKKVLVDGKPFFGNDPKMATRNLPAEIIDKIQLIDQKSEQAQFTGISDGETEKTINLTVKPDRRKGVFGRASAGYGTDDRFSANLSFNRFRQTQQLSIMGGGNNVNNTGFTFSDGFGFGGGGGGKGLGNSGGINNQNNNGLMRNWNGGINYSDEFSKNLRVSGNYFMSDVQRKNETMSQRTNKPKPDSSSYVDNNSSSVSNNRNHNANMRIEYDIDSFHSLIVTPNFSYSSGDNFSQSRNTTLNNDRDTVNSGQNYNWSYAKSPNFNGNALFRKKFDKKGRTFSTNLTFGYNSSDRESINQSQTMYDVKGNRFIDTIDQKVLQSNSSRNLGVRMSYTEPLGNDRFLEVNYGYTNNYSSTDRKTYDKDKISELYDKLDDSLTNAFNNTYSNHQTGLSVKTQRLKYNYTVGVNLQFNNLNSKNITKDSTIKQSTINFAPLAHFNYNFSRNKRLRLFYRGQTQQPTLEQLQPVPDNSNPLYIRLGNPDLKPSFSNNLNISYNNFDPVTMRSFFASAGGSMILNQIVNATYLSDDGKQTSQPVNVNGSYNMNAYVVNGFALSKEQDRQASMNTNTSLTYNRGVSFVNNQKNFTGNLNLMQSVNFIYAYKELFDFTVGGNVNYTSARFSIDKTSNYNYFNYGFNLDVNVNLPLGFIIGADADYTANTGRGEGYNVQYTMLNGFIAKSMFKKKQGQLKLQAFDLLNQNVSVSRTVADNYVEDSQTMVLQQYFMVSFTYFLNRFGGKAPRNRGEGMNIMQGDGPRGGGGRMRF